MYPVRKGRVDDAVHSEFASDILGVHDDTGQGDLRWKVGHLRAMRGLRQQRRQQVFHRLFDEAAGRLVERRVGTLN